MKKYKNQNGFLSVIVMFLVCLIVLFCLYFILDIYGFIDVPEEYSITRFLHSTEDVAYQGEINSSEEKQSRNKKVVNKVKDYEFESDGNSEIIVPETVYSNKENKTESNMDFKQSQNSYNRYYYSQLDEYGKRIYDEVLNNKENLKSGTYSIEFGKQFNELLNTNEGEKILNDAFQSSINACLLDNPDLFFLDITKMYLLTHSTTYPIKGTIYEVSIGPNDNDSYLNSSFTTSSVNLAETKLENLAKSISNKIKGNDIEKVKQIHDYLVENLEYDSTFESDNIYNLYGALINNKTVCEGYSKAFKYLLDEENIPCVVVCGIGQNSKGEIENHAWNYVFLDGDWFAVDVTWDDPIVVGGGTQSSESRYRYYLKGSSSFFKDHEEDGKVVEGAYFNYPRLCKQDF